VIMSYRRDERSGVKDLLDFLKSVRMFGWFSHIVNSRFVSI
jgi:hypothetical protein